MFWDKEEKTAIDINQLRETLIIDEGQVNEIYKDHLGYPTFGIGHLVLESDPEFGQDVGFSLALVTTGLMTVIPLLLFNAATNRLPLTITGLLQYITPSIMFIIGILVFHEPLQLVKLIGFIFIWIALAILGRDLYKLGGSVN